MKKKKSEQILHGPILPMIFSVSFPLMINNLIHTVYSLADGLWVAQLSTKHFSATSFTWPVNYLFLAIGMGVSVAGTSLISQFIGARRKKEAEDYARHLIWFGIVAGLLLSAFGFWITPFVVRWMGAEGDFFNYSTEYLRINLAFFFVDMIYFCYQAILNAQGDTKSTTLISALSAVVNIVLDPFLIFTTIPLIGLPGLGWGLSGAAYATIISKVVSVLLGSYIVKKRSREIEVSYAFGNFNPHILRHILNVGFPTAVGQSGAAFGFTILNSYINSYGTITLSAFSMVNRITDLIMMPMSGIGNALTSMIGQNMGAGQFDRAKEIFKQAMTIVLIGASVGAVLIKVFEIPILSLFIEGGNIQELYEQATEYMTYAVFTVPLMGIFNIYTGLFNGAGYTKYTMYMSLSRLWLIRIPLILFFKSMTDLGSKGVWISMVVSNAAIGLMGMYLRRKGKWLENAKLKFQKQ